MPDKRIARGIWQTSTGWRVYVRVNRKLHPKRLPASMSFGDVKKWREGWVVDLRRAAEADAPDPAIADAVPGTFADDASRYLDAVTALPTYTERVRHIKLWVELFGGRQRRGIKAVEIRRQRDRWLTVGPRLVQRGKEKVSLDAPLSGSEVNKRLRALENLYTVVDGRHAPNPVREVPEAEEADRPPRALPWAVVEAILAHLPDHSQTKARLRVMAWTGLAQAHLKKLQPSDLDLKAETVFIRGRRKGRRGKVTTSKGRTLPLLPQAVAAFREFDRLDCFGPFSVSSMWKSFRLAAGKAGYAGLRPYDFRHTFATTTVLATKDERLAQQLLDHASIETTHHYAAAAVNPQILEAFARLKATMKRRGAVTGPGNSRPSKRLRKAPQGSDRMRANRQE